MGARAEISEIPPKTPAIYPPIEHTLYQFYGNLLGYLCIHHDATSTGGQHRAHKGKKRAREKSLRLGASPPNPRLSWSGTHALQGKNTRSPRYDEKFMSTKKKFQRHGSHSKCHIIKLPRYELKEHDLCFPKYRRTPAIYPPTPMEHVSHYQAVKI